LIQILAVKAPPSANSAVVAESAAFVNRAFAPASPRKAVSGNAATRPAAFKAREFAGFPAYHAVTLSAVRSRETGEA